MYSETADSNVLQCMPRNHHETSFIVLCVLYPLVLRVTKVNAVFLSDISTECLPERTVDSA